MQYDIDILSDILLHDINRLFLSLLMSRTAYPKTITNRWGEVKIYETKNGEGGRWTAYLIRWRRGKQRFQEKLSDETKALDRAKEILESIKSGEEIVAKGAKEKLSYYVAVEQMLPPGTDLLQVVKFYIDHVGGTSPIKVSEVCKRYTDSLEQRSLSEVHLNSVRSHLARFTGCVDKELRQVTTQDVNACVQQAESPQYRANIRRTLIGMFRWAKKQGFLPAGMETAPEKADKPKIAARDPGILTPAEFTKLLRCAEQEDSPLIPFLVIGGFAGIRTAEIGRLTRSNLNLENATIPLPRSITKTGIPRTARMPDNLVAWLKKYAPEHGAVVKGCISSQVSSLCKRAGITKKHNALRHSFVTYAIHTQGSIHDIAAQCGHSMHIASKHYTSMSDPKTAAEWFNIMPTP